MKPDASVTRERWTRRSFDQLWEKTEHRSVALSGGPGSRSVQRVYTGMSRSGGREIFSSSRWYWKFLSLPLGHGVVTL